MALFTADEKIDFDFDFNSLAMKDIDGENEVFRKRNLKTCEKNCKKNSSWRRERSKYKQ